MLRRAIGSLVRGQILIMKPVSSPSPLIPQRESNRCQQIHNSPIPHAGHNKWSKIKRPKEIADTQRSKIFTKYIMQIMSSVRVDGGPNPQTNNRLSHLITQARAAGVSKVNIESAIRKASDTKQDSGELVLYEGRGRGGYSLLIEVLTDNRIKTRPILKHFLSKKGCVMGEAGSSSFNFDYKGVVRVPCKELHASKTDPLELAIEIGAEDVITDNPENENESKITATNSPNDDEGILSSEGGVSSSEGGVSSGEGGVSSGEEDNCFQFSCEPRDLKRVSDAIKDMSFTISSASLEYIPKTYVSLKQQDFEKAVALVSLLSEREEVMEVYDDFTLSN